MIRRRRASTSLRARARSGRLHLSSCGALKLGAGARLQAVAAVGRVLATFENRAIALAGRSWQTLCGLREQSKRSFDRRLPAVRRSVPLGRRGRRVRPDGHSRSAGAVAAETSTRQFVQPCISQSRRAAQLPSREPWLLATCDTVPPAAARPAGARSPTPAAHKPGLAPSRAPPPPHRRPWCRQR
jgi:hypothetical protein